MDRDEAAHALASRLVDMDIESLLRWVDELNGMGLAYAEIVADAAGLGDAIGRLV